MRRILLFFLFVIGITVPCAPSSLIAQEYIGSAPVNPQFLDYLDNRQVHMLGQPMSEYGLGLIPSPLDFAHLRGLPVFQGPRLLSYPVTYDLRTQGKLTPVRNQGSCGSCWAFATYGSLESSLMPQESLDFSEDNLINTHGFDPDPCAGGNADMATAYLSRWDGPVSEADDPYNLSSPPGLIERKHVQEVLIIPDRAGPLDNDNIKQALTTYGALHTSMYWNDGFYHSGNHAYYYTGASLSNHGVVFVGWDDNFDRNKFLSLPPGNGAFIIRNSWGSGFGENGYFYISYYDSIIGNGNYVFHEAEPTSNYENAYQYDPLGWVGSLGFGNNTAWFANIFTSVSDAPLTAVSFYTASLNSTYEIDIYTQVTSGPTSGSHGGNKTGTIALPGYHTIPLDSPVSLLTGQSFSVVVKLTTPGYNFPIPYEGPYPDYSSQAAANPGESYVSSNGSGWTDLTSISWCQECNLCLKTFTSSSSSPPGGIITASAPAVAWNPTLGKFHVAIRRTNNRIYVGTANVNGTVNNDFIQILTGTTPSAPALAWNPANNKIQLAVRGMGGNVFLGNLNADGTGWSGWTELPVTTAFSPAIAWNTSLNQLQMAVTGPANRIYVASATYTGVLINSWTPLASGTSAAGPAIAWNPTNNKVQMAIKGNANNRIYVGWVNANGTGFTRWQQLPSGNTAVSPAITWNDTTKKVEIVVKGNANNNVYKATVNHDNGGFVAFIQVASAVSVDAPAVSMDPLLSPINVFARDTGSNVAGYVTAP